ncbi:glycoside hydrolase family 30 protein [Gordonibacter massiliensis (ex Traore et al. 2017)]|uniref:Glucosylceramidase n=1 Tax=Gordonibacter massiliensis (ex Traore et al. 2017) TaxID=1841863 RepID=A0A842J8J8_9ACTN|nr:glycoside hydrolase family 30 beta sandwich domain-containing protein [Gordonibacter massiliensis (ex Traore et al. 2017)]MBC2887774.1 glucosylceramidase [Gordonibacter massiliensis (ex Traore et al. 2017)]
MRTYTTDAHGAFRREDVRFRRDERAEMELVVCRPDRTYQRIAGFGGAFTEAGAYVFAQMPPQVQDEFLLKCFGGAADGDEGRGGNAYTLCRTHVQSCDFALGNYAYVRPFDRTLRSFSIERDRQLLLPFIRCGMAVNPALELVASPWSPPAFMKTNGRMNGGGRLRKSCYGAWARLLARYVSAYAEAGVRIGRMSVQNEPMAAQRWDSCLFTAAEEAAFAADHLRPALDEAGFADVRLLMWDHNTDRIFERAEEALAVPGAWAALDGVAFHWYAGDHFEQVRAVAEAYPEKELLFTEGCVEYAREGAAGGRVGRVSDAEQQRKAEQYAHAVMGCLNAGASGFIDWNLLLDERGGPNHVRNFCEAPLMYDRGAKELVENRSFSYLGHFSRFVPPSSQRFLVSRFTDDLECAGFVRPDRRRVLVVLNRRDRAVRFEAVERPHVARLEAPPHSIMTLVWDGEEAH